MIRSQAHKRSAFQAGVEVINAAERHGAEAAKATSSNSPLPAIARQHGYDPNTVIGRMFMHGYSQGEASAQGLSFSDGVMAAAG